MLNAIALADVRLLAFTTDLRTLPGKAAHVRYTVYNSDFVIALLFISYLFIVILFTLPWAMSECLDPCI